jgi:hypothetical protein
MNRWLACSLVGTFAGFALITMSAPGCGGSSGTQTDGGPEGSSTMDHVVPEDHAVGKDVEKKDVMEFPEVGTDAGDSGGIPEEGGPTPPASGKLIVNMVTAGLTQISVVGITDGPVADALVVYQGSTATSVGAFAVPLGGGTVTTIANFTASDAAPNPSINTALVHGTVFVWTNSAADSTTGNTIGNLALIWTNATKSAPFKPALAMSAVGLVDADPTNQYVTYASTSATGTTGTLYGANLSASTVTPVTLLASTATNVTDNTGYFEPQIQFVSSSYLVAAHEEMGATTPTVSSFATAASGAWTQVDLLADPFVSGGSDPLATADTLVGIMFSTSTTGTSPGSTIAAATSAGVLETFSPGSATPTATVDTGVTAYVMNPDGTSIFYAVGAALKQYTTGTPITILASGFGGFINACSAAAAPCSTISESPNDQYTIYYNSTGKGTNEGEEDIYLTKDLAGQPGTNGILTAPSGAIFQDAFTGDSSNVLYVSNFTVEGSGGDEVGYLWAYPVSGATAAPGISITKNAMWLYNYVGTGTKIIYEDNFQTSSASSGPIGYADIKEVDVGVTPLPAATSIMTTTDVNPGGYFMTQDRSVLLWVMSQGNVHTDGIWTYAP